MVGRQGFSSTGNATKYVNGVGIFVKNNAKIIFTSRWERMCILEVKICFILLKRVLIVLN